MQRNQRRRINYLPIALLFNELHRFGNYQAAPITLILILGQVFIFLRPFHTLDEICVSAVNVYYRKDYQRLVFSAYYHGDEWHLYYNMASFLIKGLTLEQQFGSFYFTFLIMVFTLLTNCISIGLSFLGETYLNQAHYLTDCAVGFSAVIFALKVLTTYNISSNELVLGIVPIPKKYVVWVELVVIQMITPNASFVGHLSGILTGLLYVYGPLNSLMNNFNLMFKRSSRTGRFSATNERSGYRTDSASISQESYSYYPAASSSNNSEHTRRRRLDYYNIQ